VTQRQIGRRCRLARCACAHTLSHPHTPPVCAWLPVAAPSARSSVDGHKGLPQPRRPRRSCRPAGRKLLCWPVCDSCAGFFWSTSTLRLRADRWPEFLHRVIPTTAPPPATQPSAQKALQPGSGQRRGKRKSARKTALISSLYSDGTAAQTFANHLRYREKPHLNALAPAIANTGVWFPARVVLYTLLLTVLAGNCRPACNFPLRFPQPDPMTTIQQIAGQDEQHPDVALVAQVRAGDVSAYDSAGPQV